MLDTGGVGHDSEVCTWEATNVHMRNHARLVWKSLDDVTDYGLLPVSFEGNFKKPKECRYGVLPSAAGKWFQSSPFAVG